MDPHTRLQLLLFSVCLDFSLESFPDSIVEVDGYENSFQQMHCKTYKANAVTWVKLSMQDGRKYLLISSANGKDTFFDGIPVQETGVVSVNEYGTLTIKALRLADEGIYLCRNSTNVGHTLRAYNLQIFVKPLESTVSIRTFPALDKHDAWVECKARRVKPGKLMTCKWKINGQEAQQQYSKLVSNNTDATADVTHLYLMTTASPGCIDVECIPVWNNTVMGHISRTVSFIYEKSKTGSPERGTFRENAVTPCGTGAVSAEVSRAQTLHLAAISVTASVLFVLAMFIIIAIVIYRRNNICTHPQGYNDTKKENGGEATSREESCEMNKLNGAPAPQRDDRKSSAEEDQTKFDGQTETHAEDDSERHMTKRRPRREDNYIDVEIVSPDNTPEAPAKRKRHSPTVYAEIDFAKSA